MITAGVPVDPATADRATADRAAAQALTAAERLLDPVAVRDAAADARILPLICSSLSSGLAGTALLHARLSAVDSAFAEAAGQHWAEAVRLVTASGSGIYGIYGGPGAVAASMIIGAGYLPDPSPYREAITRGVRWLSDRALHIAKLHRNHVAAGGVGTHWHTFDVINGLAGIGRVLLAADAAGHRDAAPGLEVARDTLLDMMLICDGPRPGWWRPPPQHPAAIADPHNTDGANTGVAHGVAGPLAFLAACERAGLTRDRQHEAMRAAAGWLLRWRSGDNWPPQVMADNLAGDMRVVSTRGRRDAWCYGAAGIGRALIVAGDAIGDETISAAGHTALDSLADRSWDTEGPTLCHGAAGVAQSATRDSGATAERAAEMVMAEFDPGLRFGWRHSDKGTEPDQPGLLIGAAGIALLLADLGGVAAPAVTTRWDAVLLLS
ncbi:lanthionine synthetase C family protein [Nonomuraea sp. NPDC046802]|uniref:lanthionine synthetase C family protein n=1 Tax=Nonomuraea sp. NPDC046802 TaxID=3154919 RepID=UPI0033C77AB4